MESDPGLSTCFDCGNDLIGYLASQHLPSNQLVGRRNREEKRNGEALHLNLRVGA